MADMQKNDFNIMKDNLDKLADNSPAIQNTFMSKQRIIKNFLILCFGVSLHGGGYFALSNLQSTMNHARNLGVDSQSVICSTLILSSLFLPKLLIKRFGCKLTLVASVLSYLPFIAANLYTTQYTMLPTAVSLGIGSSIFWISTDTYINKLSFMDAKGVITEATLSSSRFFGTFHVFHQIANIVGNLVSFYVFSSHYDTKSPILELTSANRSLYLHTGNISCGAEFCESKAETTSPVLESQRFMLVGVFLLASLMGAIVLLLFLDSLQVDVKENNFKSVLLNIAATFKHMKKAEWQLLIVLTIFIGMEESFLFVDFNEAYVACALGLENIGLVFVCYGLTNAFTAFTAGRLLRYVPRVIPMVAAAASLFGVCIVLFFWIPNTQQIWVFYLLIGLWGFSDAILLTQLLALCGVLFHEDEEAAFANCLLWEKIGYFIVYISSNRLCTSPKIYMQLLFLTVGMTGYIALEIRTFMKKQKVTKL